MSSSISTSNTSDLIIPDETYREQPVIIGLNNTNTTTENITDISITTSEVTENMSSESTILSTQFPHTPQLSQWVYIQTPSKINLPTSTLNKTNSSNVLVNTIPQIQISNLSPNIAALGGKNTTQHITQPNNIAVSANPGVIFAQSVSGTVKPQHIVIQKPSGNVQALPVVPVTVAQNIGQKSGLAYLTMTKQFTKALEQTNTNIINRLQVGSLSKVKAPDMQVLVNSSLVTSHSVNSSINQKYVIAPMPKVTSNRLPVTATTNSVQPKIAFVPLSLPNTIPTNTSSKHKVFNFKITDGQLHPEYTGPITVMCDSNAEGTRNESHKIGEDDDKDSNKLMCEEVIDLDSPVKNNTAEEKTYELSIVEDAGLKKDMSYTITIPNDSEQIKVTIDNKVGQKETPKFSKHGVSILKKSFNLDRKPDKSQSSLIISPIPNSITTISDSNTKEVKITTSSDFKIEDPVIIAEPKINPQKSERRRKSIFACRKEYDDVIFSSDGTWNEDRARIKKYNQFESADIMLTKLAATEKENAENNKDSHKAEDFVEIEVIKENTDVRVNDEYDVCKVLNWEDGIGTLPGSDLKFQMNEFGILEYVTNEEYRRILDRRLAKAKEAKNKDDFQEEMRCLECGCYGLPSEFISPKYCSYDCQESGNKAAKERENKMKRKKKKGWFKKINEQPYTKETMDVLKIDSGHHSPSDDENTSNENSQDKYSYPWTCTKKGFSWAKYLDHIKAKSAPVKLFKDPFPYSRNGFRQGMKLEGIDPQHPSYFCVFTVAEVIGYRIRLHFDGYPDNYDFWVNADCVNIFPAGWCEKYEHVLHPPPGYTSENFSWTFYLKHTKSTAAPKHLFGNRAGNAICPNGFRVGMKLEAVDRKNSSLVCVATITDMMDNRMLVHFDSWDDIYDYWADPTSPYIHPVGWCDQYGHNLTPPNDYPSPETFTWEKYLKETKSVATPVRAFKQRPTSGFKRGMRLECVDKRAPQLIRVATVDDVREHHIRISFDGWPDRYSFWVDDDSLDIHPVGWCQKTGHPIEPPLTPDDVYDFLECATVGCRGIGNIKGPKFPTHSLQKYCPYADENIDLERVLPDRLLSPDRQLEAVVPVSREPKEKIKPRLGRPPKLPRPEITKQLDWNDEDADKKPKRKYRKRCKSESPDSKRNCLPLPSLSNGFTNSVTEHQVWAKHSKYLHEYIKNDSDPREWSEDEVVDFVTALPSCKDHGLLFSKHGIDGEAFLMLTQQDLVEILNIKLGPAIKLYNSIVLLRRNIVFT